MPTAQDRIQILEGHPPLAPGCCYVCTSVGGDGRKFMDMAKTMKKYGRIYFCSLCFEEMADNLGWMGPANVERMTITNIEMAHEIRELKEENAKLSSIIGSSIPNLISDLSAMQANVQAPKRSVGRPKKPELGITQSDSS